MIAVSQEKWDSIHSDYKGEWQNYYGDHPEWVGKKVVMSGLITEEPNELGKLLVEGVHFEIVGITPAGSGRKEFDGMREPRSEAGANGVCDYRLWTTEELIDAYAYEAKRINREDAERTKAFIKKELKRRFNATLALLDDDQTVDNPLGTYLYLLNVGK